MFTFLLALQVSSATISVNKAEAMVTAWITANGSKKLSWTKKVKLREVTPKDVKVRMGAQIFQLQSPAQNAYESDAYYIRKGKVTPMTLAFGGYGLGSMAACDLNRDSKPDLVYTYSWGSGIHRSHVAIIYNNGIKVVRDVAEKVAWQHTASLVRQDDQTVFLHVANGDQESNGLRLGRLTYFGKEKKVIDLVFDLGVSADMKKIWR